MKRKALVFNEFWKRFKSFWLTKSLERKQLAARGAYPNKGRPVHKSGDK